MNDVRPFDVIEADAVDVLADLGAPLVVAANEPPWSSVAARLPSTVNIVAMTKAWNMDLRYLEQVAANITATTDPDVLAAATVVGLGGGTGLDTAKYLAFALKLPLVQVPTITSVDAGFTDAIGVRIDGRVRYIANVRPTNVIIDLPLIRAAPPRLNRAGIGDVLSCHTGLFDWRLAAGHGDGHPLDAQLVALGEALLVELEAAVDEIAGVSEDGVRFLVDAYRRIGAACASAGHSRFEEGSEHFWAYAYEHTTGAHLVHGELIAFAVCALSHVQGNDADRAFEIVRRSRVRAHPADLGIDHETFAACLTNLAAYSRAEHLDMAVADYEPITNAMIADAWQFVNGLPTER